MNHLFVLYDARCGLCRRLRIWLEAQDQLIPLVFVAADSESAHRRFPQIDHQASLEELRVIASNGAVYYGPKAWIMCLWALRRNREMSFRLASPEWLPMARRVVAWVSSHRMELDF
ncbi:MAG: DCC1-like thiol-disulfide oxidoreductase family protein [Terriglobia bacterium]